MDFAKTQLEKYGWKIGQGLGKDNAGIKDPVKVKYKFDTDGLGLDQSEEFKYHWWDHVFNKAAKNINIHHSEQGAVVQHNGGDVILSTKRSALGKKSPPKKNILYSNFTKSSTLINSNGLLEEVSHSSSSEDEEALDKIRQCTDDDLFKICGGRTAHKGARHGLNLNGKLARLKAHEDAYLDSKTRDVVDPENDNAVGKRKKKRKRKKIRSCEKVEEHSNPKKQKLGTKNICEEITDETVHRSKKHKTKSKRKDTDVVESEQFNATTSDKPKAKKKKKKKNRTKI